MEHKKFALYWLCASLLSFSAGATASHTDISRLATQLNLASGQLAHELRGVSGYSSIRQRAERLSRESADLVDAVRRERSAHQVQSQFEDVRRRYESLEDALLRASQKRYDPWLFSELDRLNGLYTELSQEFYYTGGYGFPRAYTYSPPIIIQRYVTPPAPHGRFYGSQSWRDNATRGEHSDARRDRRDYGRIEVPRSPSREHRSPVLERQERLDNRRDPVASERDETRRQQDRAEARGDEREPEWRGRDNETGRRSRDP